MKGFYPAKSDSVCYLYLSTEKEEYVYVLPDGRVASAPREYFSSLVDMEAEKFTMEQKKINGLSHLTPSFIKFITSLEQRLLTKDDEETLGGTSKVWFIGKAIIQDKTYIFEVHKKTEVSSLKEFIDDLYEGRDPSVNIKGKSKLMLGLAEKDENKIKNYPNLFIYAK
jgi:hypothetical protein